MTRRQKKNEITKTARRFFAPYHSEFRREPLKSLPRAVQRGYAYGHWAIDAFSKYKNKKKYED